MTVTLTKADEATGVLMRVLISGASIAGPALAFWLRRYGAEVTVVERAPSPRPGGQAVDVRGVAKEVVRRMGLDREVRAACTDTGGLSLVNAAGRRLTSITVDQFGGDGMIAEIEILRGDLSRVLLDATKEGVEYVYGDRITALDEQPDGVHVSFQSGSPRVYDVVVGADGVHSGVRKLLFGDVPLQHCGMYLSFWTARNHLGLENWSLGYLEPGRASGVRTINDNQNFMAFVAFRADEIDYDYRDADAQRDLVRARTAGMGWETAKFVEQIDAPDFYFDSCSQVQIDKWSRGSVGLLGDAASCASPSAGQGTSLALVAAYVLAGELVRANGDHAAAFAAYERRLRSWVLATQKMGRDNANTTIPKNQLGVVAQRWALRAMRILPERLLMRTASSVVNGLTLPDEPALLPQAAE
ncbi:FAD-dependent monooxygenase [Amycolatopsis ultiminotia]|uniref:FAD-dependent monooxygenase n=1 Tax=Amycolatopsis ultiminotia TaxID=543629 RepID=A0ABP6WTN0_9PSEU